MFLVHVARTPPGSLIVYPQQLANGAQTVFGWFAVGVESVITFIRTVFA